MRRTAMLVSALSLAALGATVGPAQAGPAPAHSETRATAFSDQEQDTALEFWTDARLNAAKAIAAPAATPEAPAVTSSAMSSVTSSVIDDGGPRLSVPSVVFPDAETTVSAADETPLSTLASKPEAWKRGGLISRTAGKVFFENAAGGLFACSATVANSKNKSVVLTAGHCVVDARTGEVFRKWIFIPGYHKGKRPHGTFTAKKLFHLKSYVSSQGMPTGMSPSRPCGGMTAARWPRSWVVRRASSSMPRTGVTSIPSATAVRAPRATASG
ncbi:trypsin-like serine peptidase [Streptomyces sp. CA-135486]|uniref:trypsin-like serine peptidase n=1 Tax=Streptomyces sp. CA-135486 TaxID=3240049 RepID=UPI003D8FEDD5